MLNVEAWAITGARVTYSPDELDMGRRAAKFDPILNYRAANFIGFPLSRNVLKHTDKVIG
jgi:hypothetical protein